MSSVTSTTPGKPELIGPYRILTVVTAVLVLLQAVLASQWIFKGESRLLDTHEIVGNILFLAVVIQTGLAIMIRLPGKAGRNVIIVNAAMVLLTIGQIGLGYSGRDSADAKAWHVPLGVLIFGLAVAIASYAFRPADER